MSTQQDIYAAGFENRPPMLNKDNYVPWSSRLLRYAKSKPNKKLLVNSIKNGPYVRRMIVKPDDPNSVPHVAESTYEQTDDELTEKEVKQMEADDQTIQTILMGGSGYIASWLVKFLLQRGYTVKASVRDPSQDRQMQMVRGNGGINLDIILGKNVRNLNGLIVVPRIANPNANQIGNGNVVAARAEGNGNGNNGDLEEIKEVNANCILMVGSNFVSSIDIGYLD
ncbi:ribonuclease H-like domain-containing protein [Tanacetum coccineum]